MDEWEGPASDDHPHGEVDDPHLDYPPDDFGDTPAWDQSDST